MGSKLVEVGATLNVDSDALRDLKKQRRRDTLTRIAQAFIPLFSAILGILAAEEAYPVGPRVYHSYPLACSSLMLATSGRIHYGRRSWTGPIILSVALFVVAFVFVALFNTAANDNYGATPRYGVFSGVEGFGGSRA